MPAILAFIGRGLAWFMGSAIGKVLFERTIGWITEWLKNRKETKEAEAKIDAEAEKKIETIEKAKTTEDKRNAMDDILNRL